MQAYEKIGWFDKLYKKISEYLIRQFEKKRPITPEWILIRINKYFKNDFSLKLKLLALHILKNDIKNSENLTKELII